MELTKTEYAYLETLRSKLRQVIGQDYIIAPSPVGNDGVAIQTYSSDGSRDRFATDADLEKTVQKILKQKPR